MVSASENYKRRMVRYSHTSEQTSYVRIARMEVTNELANIEELASWRSGRRRRLAEEQKRLCYTMKIWRSYAKSFAIFYLVIFWLD